MDEVCRPNRKRSHNVFVRLDDEEYAEFETKVKKSGLTKQEFVSAAIFEKEIRSTDYGPEVLHELTRMGNNLNQVVKNFYTADAEKAEVMEAVKECKKTIDLVREITKKGGG